MRLFSLLLAALFLTLPLHARAADSNEMQPPQSSQDVEEPDAPDEMEQDMKDIPQPMPQPVPDVQKAAPVAPMPTPPGTPANPATPPAPEEGDTNYDRVILQGLNKVTAHTQEIDAPIGSVVRFGTIEIIAHSCWKAAPDERPENAALLEISEVKQGESPTQIFLGWMFSSSPGLSALEHPFYDVGVVKCVKAAPPVPAPAAVPAKPAKAPKKKAP